MTRALIIIGGFFTVVYVFGLGCVIVYELGRIADALVGINQRQARDDFRREELAAGLQKGSK